MKTKILIYFLLIGAIGCKNGVVENKPSDSNMPTNSNAFVASVTTSAGVIKTWQSAANKSQTLSPAIPGIDYFAIRGGIDPSELTLISFGKFTDESSVNPGRLTIYLKSVKDTGSYVLGGSSTNYAALSMLNQVGEIINYNTDNNKTGIIIISNLNLVSSTISGKFAFQATNNSSDINIKNGSFSNVPFKQ